MTKYDYDLFTIGAGSGGVRASRLAAQYGARVAIAEEDRIGGTCVIRGCVPKKLLVYASEFGKSCAEARGYGWSVGGASFDWPTLISNVHDEVDRLSGVYSRNLRTAGVEVFKTRARLKDAHTVHLAAEDRDVTANAILIATGASPFVDRSIKGWELGVTSNEIFRLQALPSRLVIAGGGYIAIEFACIFKGLGSEVTLVYRGEDILRHFDRDISVSLHAELRRMGVRIVTSAIFTSIEEIHGARRVQLSNGTSVEGDLVLWAVGRAPNTQNLGLGEAGVELDAGGAVVVDAYSRSSVESVYAIGDATNRLNLTPVAIRDGAAFAETVFHNRPTRVDHAFTPSAVFSQPPVGTIGYSEAAARQRFKSIDVYRTDFRPMKNMLSGSQSRTMMKLVVDGETDRVIGAHIVGADAPEMVQCLAIAIKAGITKRQFDDTTALHPTAAEELVLLRDKAKDPLLSQA
jgi:glutathione reductase (NADPH)